MIDRAKVNSMREYQREIMKHKPGKLITLDNRTHIAALHLIRQAIGMDDKGFKAKPKDAP